MIRAAVGIAASLFEIVACHERSALLPRSDKQDQLIIHECTIHRSITLAYYRNAELCYNFCNLEINRLKNISSEF